MAITYMHRRSSGIYEFRRMLPKTLVGKPMPVYARHELVQLLNPATGCFKQELTISLRTNDAGEGKRRDFREGTRVDDLFASAERLVASGRPMDANSGAAIDLEELRANVLAALLAADAAEREEGMIGGVCKRAKSGRNGPNLCPYPI